MKRFAKKLWFIIGILSFAAVIHHQINRFLNNYVEIARSKFDSPEAIQAITDLYSRVEANTSAHGLVKVEDKFFLRHQNVRRIPKSWLPACFSDWSLRSDNDTRGSSMLAWGDVIAYYDEKGALEGIEFYASRYGCFASRDAMKCPPRFTHAVRIAITPLFVTVRDYE